MVNHAFILSHAMCMWIVGTTFRARVTVGHGSTDRAFTARSGFTITGDFGIPNTMHLKFSCVILRFGLKFLVLHLFTS